MATYVIYVYERQRLGDKEGEIRLYLNQKSCEIFIYISIFYWPLLLATVNCSSYEFSSKYKNSVKRKARTINKYHSHYTDTTATATDTDTDTAANRVADTNRNGDGNGNTVTVAAKSKATLNGTINKSVRRFKTNRTKRKKKNKNNPKQQQTLSLFESQNKTE